MAANLPIFTLVFSFIEQMNNLPKDPGSLFYLLQIQWNGESMIRWKVVLEISNCVVFLFLPVSSCIVIAGLRSCPLSLSLLDFCFGVVSFNFWL